MLAQLLLALTAAGLTSTLAGAVISKLTGAGWGAALSAALPVFAVTLWLVLRLWQRLDGRIFAYYLMHDYAFTAQHRGAYPPLMQRRIGQFSDRIAQALQQGWDEVLVVGHSSGAYLAVSVLADLIRAGRATPENGPALGLLTLGHVVPMASFLPKAGQLRRDLRDLSVSPDLVWVDVSAPGDACCFSLCDPVAVTGIAPPDQRWPLILSAAFTQTLSPEQKKALKNRWFRLHFQYLCAFERVGLYDYFSITAGPKTLARRFGERPHSPGRIARSVNPHKGLAP